MRIYPLLTQAEQAGLPQLAAAPTLLPSKFEDSTHQIWLCDTADGRMVLKVCDHDAVAQSGFWRGVNDLFSAEFPKNLGQIKYTYALLAKQGLYEVPVFVASSSNRFVLTRYVAGEDIEAAQVTDAMVEELARHVGQLHQYRHQTWGALHAPAYKGGSWNIRLHATLLALAAQSAVAIPKLLLNEVLVQVNHLQETEFVPVMLDLRWDQFRAIDGNNELALIDVDAFVIGPRALELVLLEYVLTPQHFAIFKAAYIANNDWPDYATQKPCYQLLLFLMGVLGETDLAKWMKRI
ncbi:MAG: phosphotransferase [Methylophilaceae bacterium]